MKENKKKWAYWMTPSMVDEIQKMVDEDYAKSKSDFVCDAVDFYLNYLKTQESLDFISPLLATAVRNEIGCFEDNVCEMLFKIAVEIAKLNHITAFLNDITPDNLDEVNDACCADVARNNGFLTLEEANDFQRKMKYKE